MDNNVWSYVCIRSSSHRIRQEEPWTVAKAVRLSSWIFSLFENKRNETMQVVSLARHAGATTSCYYKERSTGKEWERERERVGAQKCFGSVHVQAHSLLFYMYTMMYVGLRKYIVSFAVIACCIRKMLLWKNRPVPCPGICSNANGSVDKLPPPDRMNHRFQHSRIFARHNTYLRIVNINGDIRFRSFTFFPLFARNTISLWYN